VKLVTYRHQGEEHIGAVAEGSIVPLTGMYPDMLCLIEAGEQGVEAACSWVKESNQCLSLSEVQLLAPIPRPVRNLYCVGWNYLAHFEERTRTDIGLPDLPTIFTKATGTAAGPLETVPLDESFTQQLDYEAELAIVIGRGGRAIREEDALSHVFGYMCANDLSARDVQFAHGGQWFMGKSMDKSCPMGPWIVTADEISDPHDLAIECRVNGMSVQSSNTRLLLFTVNRIIVELSRGMTLQAGDIILTGTPQGIGSKRNPPLFLKRGDVVEVEIERIGKLVNAIG